MIIVRSRRHYSFYSHPDEWVATTLDGGAVVILVQA